jgi:hypothetical protein
MNKGIIFYSSFIPDKQGLQKGIDFLDVYQKSFINYKLFVGIQKNSLEEWKNVLDQYNNNNNITYGNVSSNLCVDSDVSGFQKALELFYNNKKYIDLAPNSCAWFGHTKGVTTNNNVYHQYIIDNFWKQKNVIENKLNSNPSLGCFGNHLSYIPNYNQITDINNIWANYAQCGFSKRPLNFMFTNTFFVIKNFILNKMLEKINSSFFTEKIIGAYGQGDRYFFERDFIHFVDMLGYEPSFNEISPNISWKTPNMQDWENEINNWRNI